MPSYWLNMVLPCFISFNMSQVILSYIALIITAIISVDESLYSKTVFKTSENLKLTE